MVANFDGEALPLKQIEHGSLPWQPTNQFNAGRVRMDAHNFAKVKIPDRYRIPAPVDNGDFLLYYDAVQQKLHK